MNGKFFVIEGTDGAGKATQVRMLEERLKHEGYDILHQEFPRYGHPGAFVTEQYLGKEYGKLPGETASVLYTVDRFDAFKTEIEPHLTKGGIVVSDRWVTANKGHQAGKATTEEDRQKIIQYINELEHGVMGLPRATQTVFIDIQPVVGQRLSGINKNTKISGKDLHEEDVDHLLNAQRAYKRLPSSVVSVRPPA